MKILFDNGAPNPIARGLIGHEITFARQIGWGELENGELLNEAEVAGFEILLTTDKNLGYQQKLTDRKIAVVVLGQGRWTLIKNHVARVIETVNAATPGSFTLVEIPLA